MESSNVTSCAGFKRPRYMEWIRLLSAYLILTYGTRKLIGSGQFGSGSALSQRPVGSLNGYQLTWFFYGYSHAYGIILGLVQVVAGILLLFRRSALLGAAVLTPVMANILLINVFYRIAWGAEIVAAFLLASCLLLLWQERRALYGVFWSAEGDAARSASRTETIAVVFVILVVAAEAVLFAMHPTR